MFKWGFFSRENNAAFICSSVGPISRVRKALLWLWSVFTCIRLESGINTNVRKKLFCIFSLRAFKQHVDSRCHVGAKEAIQWLYNTTQCMTLTSFYPSTQCWLSSALHKHRMPSTWQIFSCSFWLQRQFTLLFFLPVGKTFRAHKHTVTIRVFSAISIIYTCHIFCFYHTYILCYLGYDNICFTIHF